MQERGRNYALNSNRETRLTDCVSSEGWELDGDGIEYFPLGGILSNICSEGWELERMVQNTSH